MNSRTMRIAIGVVNGSLALTIVGLADGAPPKACGTSLPQPKTVTVPVPPGTSPDIGQAIDLVSGQLVPNTKCVDFGKNSPTLPPDNSSASVDASSYYAETSEQVQKSTSLSGAATFGFGLWGGSVDGTYARSTDLAISSVVAVLRAKVIINPGVEYRPVKIQKEKLALLQSGKFGDFLRDCGTGYISQVLRGSEFRASYEFSARTAREKSIVQAAFNAHYGSNNISVSSMSAFESATKSVSHTTKLVSDSAPDLLPTDYATLTSTYQSFAQRAKASPRIIEIHAESYTTIHGFPLAQIDKFNQLASVLDDLGHLYVKARTTKAKLTNELRFTSAAASSDCATFAKNVQRDIDLVDAFLAKLQAAAAACASPGDKDSCFVPPACSVPTDPMPSVGSPPRACLNSCTTSLGLEFRSFIVADARRTFTCENLMPGERYVVEVDYSFNHEPACPAGPGRGYRQAWITPWIDSTQFKDELGNPPCGEHCAPAKKAATPMQLAKVVQDDEALSAAIDLNNRLRGECRADASGHVTIRPARPGE